MTKTHEFYFALCTLAQNIKFDDNKLMINKIKDFLKNKLPRRKRKQSDQDEVTGPEDSGSQEQSPGEKTGDFALNEAIGETNKPSIKERFTDAMAAFKAKYHARKLRPLTVPTESKGGNEKSKLTLALLSPRVGKNIEKILSRPSREPIHQTFLVVLICAITYSLGKITALTLKGAPALDSARDFAVSIALEKDFNANTLLQVKSVNPFRTNTGLGNKVKIADTKCEKSQGVSNLPIKLVNTIVLQDTVKSLASVQIRGDRSLQEVREGEQISNLAKIFKIDRLELLVKNLESGVCESIVSTSIKERGGTPISVMSPSQSRAYLKNKPLPGIENTGNKFKISKTLIDEKMKDIAAILTQARAIKIQNPDGSLSFKMTEMDPEGIFPYLGLQDQDIITSINGKPIYDMNEVMTLFSKIKNLDQLSLGIKREGTDSVQEYTIKK